MDIGTTLGERVLTGLNVSLIGMTITIAALVALSLVIVVLSRAVNAAVNRNNGKGGSGGDATANGTGAAANVSGGKNISMAAIDGAAGGIDAAVEYKASDAAGELIAVFTAAIAAMSEGRPFRVTSFRKTGQSAPVWNLRGRNEYISGKM